MAAPIIPIIAGAVSAIGAISSVMGGVSGRKDARRAGRASARFILEETGETLRRKGIENRNIMGAARVAQGASNLQFSSGSQSQYATFLSKELQRRDYWTERAGGLRAAAAKRGANITGDAALNRGISSGIGYGLQAFSFAQQINPPSSKT